jgi:hypothetical protein
MLGAEVTELIHSYVVGSTLDTTDQELMETTYRTRRRAKCCMRAC